MMTFSKPFGFLKAGKDWNYALHQIRAAVDSAGWVGQNPWFYRACQRAITPIFGNHFGLANRNGAVRDFVTKQLVDRQTREAPSQPDIMQKLLRVNDAKPQAFNDDAVRSIVSTNILGGAETTTLTFRAIIYFLTGTRPQ